MDSTASFQVAEPALPLSVLLPNATAYSAAPARSGTANNGKVCLNREQLVALRQSLMLSQDELAVLCWQRNLRLSIATLKRAETGHPVLFRTARELARLYGVPVRSLVC